MLLDLLAPLVFLLPVGFHDRIDSFLNGLLVAFLTDFHDLTNHNILQAILKQVGSGPVLLHIPILNDLLLGTLLDFSQLLIIHVEAFLAREIALELGDTVSKLLLPPCKHFLSRVLDQLVSDFLWEGHDVVERDRLHVFDDLELVLVENCAELGMLFDDLVHLLL